MNKFFDIDKSTIGINYKWYGEYITLLFDKEDYELIKQYNLIICTQGYIQCRKKKTKDKLIMIHNILMKPSYNMEIDHINGIKHDNRKSNFRICTHAENMKNKKSHKGKKYKGVYRDNFKLLGKCYYTQIKINGKNKHIGYFKTEKEAAEAYNKAAKKHYGDFAYLNSL